jgi:hypothetical protein
MRRQSTHQQAFGKQPVCRPGAIRAKSRPNCPEGGFSHLQEQKLALVILAVRHSREAEIGTCPNLVRPTDNYYPSTPSVAHDLGLRLRIHC